jgi:hypothetical protein
MTHHPYGPDELDREAPELDELAHRLEDYASSGGGEPPLDLATRVHAAIDAEPDPSRGWLASLTEWWRAGPVRAMAVIAVVALAVLGAVALGEIALNARNQNVGTEPTPRVEQSSAPVPSSTASENASPSASATPSTTSLPSPTDAQATPVETVEPSESGDDHGGDRTPRPSESDHSGPGGGGDDGGGDDSSGRGG